MHAHVLCCGCLPAGSTGGSVHASNPDPDPEPTNADRNPHPDPSPDPSPGPTPGPTPDANPNANPNPGDFILCNANKNGGCNNFCEDEAKKTTDIAREGGPETNRAEKNMTVRCFVDTSRTLALALTLAIPLLPLPPPRYGSLEATS